MEDNAWDEGDSGWIETKVDEQVWYIQTANLIQMVHDLMMEFKDGWPTLNTRDTNTPPYNLEAPQSTYKNAILTKRKNFLNKMLIQELYWGKHE